MASPVLAVVAVVASEVVSSSSSASESVTSVGTSDGPVTEANGAPRVVLLALRTT